MNSISANRQDRIQSLKDSIRRRVLVLDGAMGTALQNKNLSAQDFGGTELEGCNENLVLTRPDVILEIHEAYLAAGCDIIETNTFGSTPLVLDEYGLGAKAREINLAAASLARRAAEKYSTADQPRFVAGSVGPTTKAISVTGGITFEALKQNFFAQCEALWHGGVDYLLLETCQDTRNVKAALLAIDALEHKLGEKIPVAVSGTIEPMGTMLAGQSVESLLTSLEHRDLLYIGLNCATGPEFMTDHIRSLAKLSPFPIACVPNAGLPDEDGCYLETPESVTAVISRFLSNGWLNLIGGCCGTHAGHIRAMRELAMRSKPRVAAPARVSALSGIDYLEITDEMRPVLVGERTNVIGSKKFRELITAGKFDEASDIAKGQVKTGAQIIDVCLANPDRDEIEDMRSFLDLLVRKIRAPLMIDSTDEKVIELALTYCQGKAIINSINLEDGEERYEKVVPLARRYGAALVVGTIDDDKLQGMGVKRERKLEIARRSYKLLTEKYGVPPQDIYWDPLVFPCATGDAQYVGSALETIEGVRLIKNEFPATKTVLGISNVSFGLPPAGREVLNSVFLYHCVQAGLDLAIVNAEKLVRYTSIPEEERKLADDLLFNRGDDPINAFANHFRQARVKAAESRATLPLDQRLSNAVIEGSKEGLIDDLNEAMRTMAPLEIINGPLMRGMDEVGRLFGENKLIVAEVLQSAEVMKASVAHLEPFMSKSAAASRGKVLLATVKGDVHDIGKNLVEIILANNGFEIVNLGIKVPPEQLIQAIREHSPDIVGLSGLLVKSAQQMIVTAEDLSRAGVTPPVLVGGAALSEKFVDTRIAPAYSGDVSYASDAMHGLELAKQIVSAEEFAKLRDLNQKRRASLAQKDLGLRKSIPDAVVPQKRSPLVPVLDPMAVPAPPDFEKHVLKNTPIEQIWAFVNPLMLYGRHLGIRGGVIRQLEENPRKVEDTKARAIWDAVAQVKEEFGHTDALKPAAVYRFFPARALGNQVEIIGHSASFEFPRQRKEHGLCLADYLREDSDNLALFVTTVGKNVRELAQSLKERGEYLKSHIIQVLALESAEAYAELLHSHLRKLWGFPDLPEMTMMQRFQAKYRGKRYSFGYPACPRLDDQRILFDLLEPSSIGVQLTDGFMMDPEASVSALAFHHPDATYFSVGEGVDENR